MKVRLFLPLTLVLLLGACASNTPYRSAEGGKYGYRDASLGDDRHRVVFTQRSADLAQAMDYALLRAAELTLLEGKDWFIVRDRQTTRDREREPAASVSLSQGRVVERDCGLLGCRTTSRPAPVTTHGTVRSGSSRAEVQAILEVELGSGSKPENADVYTATETRNALRSRLGVNS